MDVLQSRDIPMAQFINDGSPADTIIIGIQGQTGQRVEAARVDIFAVDSDGTADGTATITVTAIGTDSAVSAGSVTVTYTDPLFS
jgi:hypothetical protein